jgi:hypothetical protein
VPARQQALQALNCVRCGSSTGSAGAQKRALRVVNCAPSPWRKVGCDATRVWCIMDAEPLARRNFLISMSSAIWTMFNVRCWSRGSSRWLVMAKGIGHRGLPLAHRGWGEASCERRGSKSDVDLICDLERSRAANRSVSFIAVRIFGAGDAGGEPRVVRAARARDLRRWGPARDGLAGQEAADRGRRRWGSSTGRCGSTKGSEQRQGRAPNALRLDGRAVDAVGRRGAVCDGGPCAQKLWKGVGRLWASGSGPTTGAAAAGPDVAGLARLAGQTLLVVVRWPATTRLARVSYR